MLRLDVNKVLAALMIGFLILLPAFYFNIDLIAKSCYSLVEQIKVKTGIKSAKGVKSNPDLKAGQVGPPGQDTSVDTFDDGNRLRVVVSRGGQTREFWVGSEFRKPYEDIGGINGILGVPTSNQYSWRGGIRQDFERDHWLYWSKQTGVRLDFLPAGYRSNGISPLQVPIFAEGKPAVKWASSASDAYFITQNFGTNGHFGQDLALAGNPNPGYEVRPITEGVVLYSGWTGSNSYGYLVLIQHTLTDGRKFYSQYAHLYQMPEVFSGQWVSKETVLGRVGNTGKSTGPHLDFQIKEIPRLDHNPGTAVNSSDLGFGYAPGHKFFSGNIYYDSRTNQTYYKPSYFIENYKYNPGEMLDVMYKLRDILSPSAPFFGKSFLKR